MLRNWENNGADYKISSLQNPSWGKYENMLRGEMVGVGQ